MKLESQPEAPPAPQVPYSIFTTGQKTVITIIVSVAASFSGLASNIYNPSIPTIAADFGVAPELINLTVTSYMIFQGLSPTLWGAIADVQGRRVTYICTFLVFFSACIGLAETTHYYQLVILRCLQSTGSASTIAIGAGVIGDITTREERGGYMGFYQAGLLFPTAGGPILGGIFAGTLGWRAIFWFLTIFSGTFLIFLVVFLPETLRSLVGNGSIPAKGLGQSLIAYLQLRRHDETELELSRTLSGAPSRKRLQLDFTGPLRIVFGGEVTWIIIFLSIYYTVWQMTITALSTFFHETYGLSQIEIGLTYIANGVGCIVGTMTTGKFLDFDYRRIKNSFTGNAEDFPLEHARLRTIWLWAAMQIAATVVFGWTLQNKVHISVPIICTFVMGWSSCATQSVITTLLVDIYSTRSASATAALNLARCLMGAGGTAAVVPIANGMGVGWEFTMLAGILVLSLGLVVIQSRYGAKKRLKREKLERS
ncbi:MFS general substrate transporter [Lophium mytilinum]|uniref:MFS general substrate transporter n=1 Tax=Lophium mytilinum TaxID=390894 RepID=A0A6A6RE46_9PEZI|nr:MFS general substrate transporter [Lophium mytilinum]